MLIAITRTPSERLCDCLLTHMQREPIDMDLALSQHKAYRQTLSDLGVRVVNLPAEPDMPDCVFMEDTAVVVDEVAVLATMGAASRKRELPSVAAALREHRRIEELRAPATLEGGDIFQIDRTLYVGQSTRTNRQGAEALQRILTPLGYTTRTVDVHGCLHLSTGASHVGGGVVIANPNWIDTAALAPLEVIEVDPTEPWAGNTLLVGDHVVVPSACARTAEALTRRGLRVVTTDISEFAKAEAGLTCMCLLFESETHAE